MRTYHSRRRRIRKFLQSARRGILEESRVRPPGTKKGNELRARQLVPTRPFRLPADSAAAQNGDFTRRRTPGETVRVLPVVLPVVFAGGVAITIAAWTFVGTKPSWSQLAGIFVLLAAST